MTMTQRTDKKLKDLRPGDRVELENGGIGTILSVKMATTAP